MLAAAGGFSAWAAQPAREPLAAGPRFTVFITLEIGGETRRFEIHEAAGTPFSLAAEAGDHRYEGKFSLRDPMTTR